MREQDDAEVFEFSLYATDSQLRADEVDRLLQEAARSAAEAMEREEGVEIEAKAEIPGAFGGLGETLVVLVLSAAAKKLGEELGKQFFDRYLGPALRKRNLVPSRFRRGHPKRGAKKS